MKKNSFCYLAKHSYGVLQLCHSDSSVDTTLLCSKYIVIRDMHAQMKPTASPTQLEKL